jgi:endonuclease YncB( thermonuclease family)
MNLKTLSAAIAIGLVMWLVVIYAAVKAFGVPVDYTVDGDTLRLGDGQYVRIIGIDTPEVGQCGYEKAKSLTNRLAGYDVTLRLPRGHEPRDHYGRLLRYAFADDGRDIGAVLLRRGLANARYDDWDGYDWHPKMYRYRQIDQNTPHVCPGLD